jgi:hypothetical protein
MCILLADDRKDVAGAPAHADRFAKRRLELVAAGGEFADEVAQGALDRLRVRLLAVSTI